MIINALHLVGMTRFELATTRPPDAYSNRTELHPAFILNASAKIYILRLMCKYFANIFQKNKKTTTFLCITILILIFAM